jgi:NADH-quinone oxidoreductase subunit E
MSVRRLAPKQLQPANFTFTAENLAWAKQQIAKFPPGRQASAVIPILWRVQEQHDGWVSEAAIRAVADLLDMPYIRALEIATFYTMFQLQPVGKKAHIQVCGTTPCRLRGAEALIEVCRHRIHHDPFHLSADGDFSWEEVECLGACVNAPMVLIWSDTYEDLTKESFGKVLDGFANGNPPKPGPQNGRQFSAPIGGLTTLKNGGGGATNPSGAPKQPVLSDAESKKPGEAANVHERPSPKPPGDDATRKNPP